MVGADDTRGRILAVGTRLFGARGYNAVGVQELCESSGITKPTLYHHFGSKLGLLEAIAEERYGHFLGEVAGAMKYRPDLAGALRETMSVFSNEDPDFTRLRLSVAFSPPDSEEFATFRPFTDRLYAVARRFFVDAAKEHGNMKRRDLAYAASFIGTVDAYVGLSIAGALKIDQAVVREAVRQFLHGVYS